MNKADVIEAVQTAYNRARDHYPDKYGVKESHGAALILLFLSGLLNLDIDEEAR